MKRIFLPRLVIGLITAGVIGGVIQFAPAHAQTGDSHAAQGLQISPALVELNAEKGQTYTLKLKVTNVTLTKLVYNASVNDFKAKDETSSPQILLNGSLPSSASVVNWISVPNNFTLDTQQSLTISANVTIPNNAEPGGHYGVIQFSSHAPDVEGTGVGLSASAGVLVLIRVAGNINESASLASFFTATNGKQTSLFESPSIGFVTRIKNEGNIHVKPTGTIVIQDAFGNLVGTVTVNDTKSNLLPDSIRRFDGEYNKGGWMFGMYTANLALGYGTTGQAITNTITFWVIPYKLILAGLLVLITFIFISSRLIRVYNRHVIAKAKNENTHTKKTRKSKK